MKIEVSTDADRIASLRQFALERTPADPLERFFNGLSEKYTFTKSELELLRERRDEAVPRLLEVAEREHKNLEVGGPAILALCLLEEPLVMPIARRVLKSTDRRGWGSSYRQALFEPEARFLGTDPEIRQKLLARLDTEDPKRLREAIQECGILDLPGALEKFADMIVRPGMTCRGQMAYLMSRWALTREHLDLIRSVWLDGEGALGDEDGEFLAAVSQVADEGPEEIRPAAAELVLRWFAELCDGSRRLEFMTGSAVVLGALKVLRRAVERDRRVFEVTLDLVRANHPVFQTFQRDALGLLAAGDRDVYRAECLRMLESPDVHAARAAAESLGLTAAGTADEGLVAAIRAARVRHGGGDEFAEALARLGGSEASTAAEADSDEQGPITRMRVFWRNKGLNLDRALGRLEELGALPEGRVPTELAGEVRRAFRENWPDGEERSSDLFLQALGAAGILAEFDTEADVIPPPHDELILEIADACAPLFSVESARQTWKLPRGVKDPDDLDDDQLEKTSYVVEFLHNGRLYTFRADYFGDWYDAGGVTTALNFALRDAGRAERFHPIDTEGQETTLVLVTPGTAKILQNEFLVPVGKAPEQSLGQGRGKKARRREED